MRRLAPLLAVAVLLFAAAAAGAYENSELTSYIIKGKNAIRDGQPDKAFWYFYVAGSIDRQDPLPWYYMGMCLFRLGDTRNAMESFNWALHYDLTENFRKPAREFMVKCKYRLIGTKPHPVMAKFAKVQSSLWQAYRLMENGEYEPAAAILEPIYNQLPYDFEIASSVALCMLHLNRVDDAFKPIRYCYKVAKKTFGNLLEAHRLPKASIYDKVEKLLKQEFEVENYFKD